MDCSLAVVAMLAGCAYEEVRASADDLEGAHSKRVLNLLILNTRRRHVCKTMPDNTRVPLSLMPVPALASAWLIRKKHDRYAHWIAVKGQRVYDPEYAHPMNRKTYEKADWHVLVVIEPA